MAIFLLPVDDDFDNEGDVIELQMHYTELDVYTYIEQT